jgi:hypothetical protein
MEIRTKAFLSAAECAQRVMDTRDAEYGGIKTIGARVDFDDAVASVTDLCNLQDPLGFRSSTERDVVSAARVAIRKQFMKPVSRIARAQRGDIPGIRQLRVPPFNIDKAGFVSAGREMVSAVAQHADVFTKAGVSADFLTRFTTALDSYSDATNTRREGQKGRVGVTAAVKAAVSRGTKAIRILDSLIAPRIESNPQLRAEWESTMGMFSRMYRPGVLVKVAAPAAPNSATASATSPSTSPATPSAVSVSNIAPAVLAGGGMVGTQEPETAVAGHAVPAVPVVPVAPVVVVPAVPQAS